MPTAKQVLDTMFTTAQFAAQIAQTEMDAAAPGSQEYNLAAAIQARELATVANIKSWVATGFDDDPLGMMNKVIDYQQRESRLTKAASDLAQACGDTADLFERLVIQSDREHADLYGLLRVALSRTSIALRGIATAAPPGGSVKAEEYFIQAQLAYARLREMLMLDDDGDLDAVDNSVD